MNAIKKIKKRLKNIFDNHIFNFLLVRGIFLLFHEKKIKKSMIE